MVPTSYPPPRTFWLTPNQPLLPTSQSRTPPSGPYHSPESPPTDLSPLFTSQARGYPFPSTELPHYVAEPGLARAHGTTLAEGHDPPEFPNRFASRPYLHGSMTLPVRLPLPVPVPIPGSVPASTPLSMSVPMPMPMPMPMHIQGGMEVDPFYNPALVPLQRGKKGRAAKKTDGKQPTFLTKLYHILEQPEYHSIIRWDETGEIIVIEKPLELAHKILPAVYRQSRFASFSRQLNIYGFMRKVSLRHVEAEIIDPDASTWSHPFLRRDSAKEDIVGFKRRVPPRPSQARRRISVQEEVISPSSSEGSAPDQQDAYAHHLLRDHEDDHAAFLPSLPPIAPVPLGMALDQSPEQSSPSSEEFDFGWNDSRRFSLSQEVLPPVPSTLTHSPAVFKPLNKLTELGVPNYYGLSPTSMIPQSAPAHAQSFALQNLTRVTQGHLRTRSVQGEPPSATLFSPMSPLAGQSWLPSSDDIADIKIETPTMAPSVPHTPIREWMKRGLSDYSFTLSGTVNESAGFDGPSSLPHGFAPKPYFPMINGGYLPTELQPHPPSFLVALPGDPHSQAEPLSMRRWFDGNPSQTLSPELHRLDPPLFNRTTKHTASPRQVSRSTTIPMRQERRASVSSGPYSPPSRPSSSILRKLRGRGSSGGYWDRGEAEDETPPSEGLKGIGAHPFQSVLREEGEISEDEMM